MKFTVSRAASLDIIHFLGCTGRRKKVIKFASAKKPDDDCGIIPGVSAIHPGTQTVITESVDKIGKDFVKIRMKSADGKQLAGFKAGAYISLFLHIGNSVVTRAYTLTSSPKDAAKGVYEIAVKKTPDGFVSGWLNDSLKVGDKLRISSPSGDFSYNRFRDAKNIIAAAGGSGITPFVSMARAIEEGSEDFNLTVLYGSRTYSDSVFGDELERIAAVTPKVKLVRVLSDEILTDCESGFITADLIRKYSNGDKFSIFACGPTQMYEFLKDEVSKLGIAKKYFRCEMPILPTDPTKLTDFPRQLIEKCFTLNITVRGKAFSIPCAVKETVMTAIERAGIPIPAGCHAGVCGLCHSKLISGNVFIPTVFDYRRAADALLGYIHPCVSYPMSDLTVEV